MNWFDILDIVSVHCYLLLSIKYKGNIKANQMSEHLLTRSSQMVLVSFTDTFASLLHAHALSCVFSVCFMLWSVKLVKMNLKLQISLHVFSETGLEIKDEGPQRNNKTNVYVHIQPFHAYVYNKSLHVICVCLNTYRSKCVQSHSLTLMASCDFPKSPCKNKCSFHSTQIRANELSTKDDETPFSHL